MQNPGSVPSLAPIDVRLTATFVVLAAIIGTVFVFARGQSKSATLDEEPRVGAHLARGHGYRSPLDPSPNAEPTAWMPPVYPLIVAGAYGVFGIESASSLQMLLLVNVLGYALVVGAAFAVGKLAFSRTAGVAAAMFVLLHPLFLLRTTYYWHTFVALAALGWLTVLAIMMGHARARLVSVLLLGAGLAGLVLVDASLVCVPPLLVLLATRALPTAMRIRAAGVALLGFGVILSPWVLRNYLALHQFVPVRSGASLELWLGNIPGSSGWMDLRQHPSVYPPEQNLMRTLGEKDYFELCRRRFLADVRRAPGAFIIRCARRFGYLFVGKAQTEGIKLINLSSRSTIARVFLDAAVTLLGAFGFVLAWRRHPLGRWVLLLSLAASAPFVVSHVSYRYSMPVRWACLVAAGYAVSSLLSHGRTRTDAQMGSQAAGLTSP